MGRLRATPCAAGVDRSIQIAANLFVGWSRKWAAGLCGLRWLTFEFVARLLGTTCQFLL
jgi:hypothetical protein